MSESAGRALLMACHPLPSAAVTALTGLLAVAAGLSPGRTLLVVVAVLAGQLSIGWSNDYLDAERDRTVRRADKPLATGALPPLVVGRAAGLALGVTAAASVLLGPAAGAVNLLTVGCGWLYNLRLKATALSPLPYAVAFGLLPAIVTAAASPSRPPPAWAVAAGAMLGVAAHGANVLPDLVDDAGVGVRGLPHRLGARVTAVGVAGLLVLAAAAVLLGSAATVTAWRLAALAVAAGAAGAAGWSAVRRPPSRAYFLVVVALAGADVLLLAASGARL